MNSKQKDCQHRQPSTTVKIFSCGFAKCPRVYLNKPTQKWPNRLDCGYVPPSAFGVNPDSLWRLEVISPNGWMIALYCFQQPRRHYEVCQPAHHKTDCNHECHKCIHWRDRVRWCFWSNRYRHDRTAFEWGGQHGSDRMPINYIIKIHEDGCSSSC